MHYKYQSPWFVEALQSEGKLEINELKTDITSDICIVGGGFTGLWTALKIKEKNSSINVTIIEKDLCGSGASGRNGGCMIPQSTKFTAMKNTIGIKDAKKWSMLQKMQFIILEIIVYKITLMQKLEWVE